MQKKTAPLGHESPPLMAQSNSTILLTGHAGFIGFHTAHKLLEAGHKVVGIDNLNDYYSPALKRARQEKLFGFKSFTHYECDICDFNSLSEIGQRHQARIILHLAAQAGVRYSITNPLAYAHANLLGFANILELGRALSIDRLVYASSSSVYGGNQKVPFAEQDRVDAPVSLYAATKKSNELMAHSYSHLFNLQTIGLRFFTVYGPWGRPDMAYWLFCERIRNNQPIKVFNHGDLRRDFTYIDDCVAGIIAALFTPDLANYAIYNLGNHRSENLEDFISLLEQALKTKAHKQYLPMQAGDVKTTFADISAAQKDLGFKPQTGLDVGLSNFVTWYQAYTNQSEYAV